MAGVLRSTVSGLVLSLQAAPFNGVVGQTTVISVTPVVVPGFAPVFTTTNTQIGTTVSVDQGLWAPTDSIINVEIGVGTTQQEFDNYTGPKISGTFGTIPSEWLGETISSTVTAINGTASTKYFVNSGLVVSGTNTDWPADIASGDWSVEEIRDTEPEGRRTVLVDSSVVVPSGYLLKFYSGNTDLGPPTAFGATLTPGTVYNTSGTLAVNSICYNSLAWLRISDGAIKRAHPDVEQKQFRMAGLLITNPPSVGDLSPDVVVGSIAAVRSQIQSWIANWNGTIPSGKTATSDRVIGINVSTSGTFDLTGLVNNNATRSTGRIFVRGMGTFTHYASSQRHTGYFLLNNSRGIWGALMYINVNGNNYGFDTNRSTLCGMTRCIIEGQDLWSQRTTVQPTTNYPAIIQFCTNFTMTHCLTRFSGANINAAGKPGVAANGLTIQGDTGTIIIGHMHDWNSTDDFHIFGGGTESLSIIRCWGGRRKTQNLASDPHEDFCQSEGGRLANCKFTHNVYVQGYSGFWYGTSISPWALQMFFYKNEANQAAGQNAVNSIWEQNIGFHNNGSVKAGGGTWTGTAIRDNTFVTIGLPQNHGIQINAPSPTKERNFLVGGNNGQGGITWVSGGATDIILTIGPWNTTTTTADDARDYSALANWFEYGIPFQSANGTLKNASTVGALREMYPKVGTRLHYDFSGTTIGAALRCKEIYNQTYRYAQETALGYPVVPGDVGWPVAATWQDVYNLDDFVKTRFSNFTAYNTNGNIV